MTRLLYTSITLLLFWIGLSYLTIPETPIVEPPPFLDQHTLEPEFAELTQEYLSYFNTVMEKTKTPGAAIVIVKDNSIYALQGFGVKRVNTLSLIHI